MIEEKWFGNCHQTINTEAIIKENWIYKTMSSRKNRRLGKIMRKKMIIPTGS